MCVSEEKIYKKELERSGSTIPKLSEGKLPSRVNINDLLSKVKEQEKKDNKTNLIFLSLFGLFIFILGIILSQ